MKGRSKDGITAVQITSTLKTNKETNCKIITFQIVSPYPLIVMSIVKMVFFNFTRLYSADIAFLFK
jgi:hypothetical protein